MNWTHVLPMTKENVDSRPLIVLFAKAPTPGRVKTRLLPLLTPDQATALHKAMVRDALEMLMGLQHLADIEIHTDVPTEEWADFRFPRRIQPGGGLGERLHLTMSRALENGHPAVLILGSDSPGLPLSHVTSLLESSADVKLGPTEDGGFYGISARRVMPRMFEEIRWSTADALSDRRLSVELCGLSVEIGDCWFDVDEPSDLMKVWCGGRRVGSNTAGWFDRAGEFRALLHGAGTLRPAAVLPAAN